MPALFPTPLGSGSEGEPVTFTAALLAPPRPGSPQTRGQQRPQPPQTSQPKPETHRPLLGSTQLGLAARVFTAARPTQRHRRDIVNDALTGLNTGSSVVNSLDIQGLNEKIEQHG
ncbi:hypothetical protein chiPu_0030252 [Chiloscyllium punctatum]|uniref:Uncharacterized protein n=1 Tax=Chiloscyllium punctatum TaxID=137246 RepID=A0A401TTV4_CHIPU|nr:hypothetical protein [Chiloscyllium punctatum]